MSDSSASLKLSPPTVDKKYSNKEFLYGDDDDSDEDATKSSKEAADLKNSEMFEPLVKPETEAAIKEQQQQQDTESESEANLDDLEPEEDDGELDKLLDAMYAQDSHLQRAQRTDPKHSMHDKFGSRLTKFHKNGQLQKELASLSSESDEAASLDYDELMNSLFKMNTDQFESDMNTDEIGSILSSYKAGKETPKMAKEKSSSEKLMDILNDEEEMNGFNIKSMGGGGAFGGLSGFGGLSALLGGKMAPKNKETKQKPVFNFKERIFSENDYNKQFKTAAAAAIFSGKQLDSNADSFKKTSKQKLNARCRCVCCCWCWCFWHYFTRFSWTKRMLIFRDGRLVKRTMWYSNCWIFLVNKQYKFVELSIIDILARNFQ